MRISKTTLWLSVIDALLVLTASASGIFLTSIYARETPSWAIQGIGQDIVNLVAVVVLFIAAYFVNRGSVKAFLVWSGVLLYLIYAYVIYAFDIHYNRLFLVYVAILGLSFYALVGSVIRLHLDQLQSSFSANTKARAVSVFLLVLGMVFYLLWLSEEIPALLTGKIPPSVTENGLLTNPVHVLDLGLLLPGMIITGVLLWRRKLLGYLLAIPLLVFNILTGTAILVIFLVMSMKGMPTSVGVEAFIAIIIVVSLPERALCTRSERTEERRSSQQEEGTNMTVLVAYASKHGSTQGIAKRIAEQLRQLGIQAEARPLDEVSDPGSYEALVIGSALYYGSWLHEATEWVRRNQAVLAERPMWLFSVGPLGTEVKDAEQQPKEMAEFQQAIRPREQRVFFGALDHQRLSFAERMVVKAVRAPEGDFRDWEAIDAWAASIARDLG